MRKAVFSTLLVLTLLLCAQTPNAVAHHKTMPLPPAISELGEAELESELLVSSEISLESDFERKLGQLPYFTVKVIYTAYYGPKPNQKVYALGSYANDVAMNGAGKETAYGTRPRRGIVATDPKIFPRGTLLAMIDPLDGREKIFVAEDKGGHIKGRRIDIFVGFGNQGLRNTKLVHRNKSNEMLVKVLYRPPIENS